MHPSRVVSPPSPFTALAYSYYAAVLESLTGVTENHSSERATALGAGALQRGLDVMDLTSIHQITMVKLLSAASDRDEQAHVARVASLFFHQCLEPFLVAKKTG